MSPYVFDNAAEAETAERFASLDALYNFRTFRFLETGGIGPGWHCLEVGGGSGSVATWMADRVGPSGYVLVTDIDPRFMEGSAYCRPAHVELRRHDIGTDPLPEHAFDLIHARLVLQHVPQRQDALASLVAALKPRGWLVIEEFDGRIIDRAIATADASEGARFRKMGQALRRLLDERGFEADWPRRLYRHLKAAGLTEVGMEGHLAVCEGGGLGVSLDAANFAQVRKEAVARGLITDAEIDAVLARLDAPDFAVFSPVMFTAWGRRPDLAIFSHARGTSNLGDGSWLSEQASKRQKLQSGGPLGSSRPHVRRLRCSNPMK
jgi:ubiquinone/menaquinone biosynthesis C-methylase UbiE